MKNPFLLIILLFLIGCSTSQKEQRGEVIKVDIKKDLVTRKEIIALRNDVKIVPLKSSELPTIDLIACHDNRFYVLSSAQNIVYAFDAEGNFLFKIDKKGKAKGEYLMVDGIVPLDDVIRVCDNWSAKIIDYSSVDGSFVAEHILEARYDNAMSNGDITAVYFDNDRQKMVSVYNQSMDELYESVEKLPELEKISFGQNTALFTHKGTIYCNPKLSNEIYIIGKDSISLKYNIDFGDAKLTENVLKGIIDRNEGFNDLISLGYASLFDFFNISDSFLNFIFAYSNSLYTVFYNTQTKKTNVLLLNDYMYTDDIENAYIFSSFVGLAITKDGYSVNSINSSTFADGVMDKFRENDPLLADKLTEAAKNNDSDYEYYLILQKYK